MKKGKHRKYDKPFYLRWPGKWPFKYIWYLWNPFRFVDKKHRIITDIYNRHKAKKFSIKERQRRKDAGQGEKLCYSCTIVRSMGFSGDSG